MLNLIQRRRHPEGYQGRGMAPPYFEGWYFKLVDRGETHRYTFIPGVSLGASDGGPHSFVQVLDGATGETSYRRYPVAAFTAAEDRLDVRVGPNRFTADGVQLDLVHNEVLIQGAVHFGDIRPWPVTFVSPGIMGWYAWVPRMECYHGVLSLDHRLQGNLTIGGEEVDFGGGRGYIEKDWGQAFPSGWVWTQTNHFSRPGTCLTASIAMIPWIGSDFPGFIVGLLRGRTLLRFATYTGAKTRHLELTEHGVIWLIEDAVYRLEIRARRGPAGALRGPSKVDMGRPVPETLSATVDVTLKSRHDGTTIFQDTGHHAGLEIVGQLEGLLTVGKAK
ncbi:MAG: tocopherol cyclase family protein [Anaerolineae bacterium]